MSFSESVRPLVQIPIQNPHYTPFKSRWKRGQIEFSFADFAWKEIWVKPIAGNYPLA